MKSALSVIALSLLLGSTAAMASQTFQSQDGQTWTIVKGGDGADISKLRMFPSAAKACPSRMIELEPVDAKRVGPRMDKEQRNRGDKRWHIVCIHNAPAAADVNPAPQGQMPPNTGEQHPTITAPQRPSIQQTEQSGMPDIHMLTPQQREQLLRELQQGQQQSAVPHPPATMDAVYRRQ